MKRTTISHKKATPYEILFARAQNIAIIDLVNKQLNKELREAMRKGEISPEVHVLRDQAAAINAVLTTLEAVQLEYMEEHPEAVKQYKTMYLDAILSTHEESRREASRKDGQPKCEIIEIEPGCWGRAPEKSLR